MEKENIEFLINLQKELQTQETDCQANPRFWVVAQYEYEPCWQEQADKTIYIGDEDDDVFDNLDELLDFLYENEYIENEPRENFKDIYDLESFYDVTEVPVKRVHKIMQNTFFLTKRECQEHIKSNHYHYNDTVHTYAMTAWRSPQVEKLIKILTNFKFNDEEESNKEIAAIEKKYNLGE